MKIPLALLLITLSTVSLANQALKIELAKGQRTFTVSLPANPTTGYLWKLNRFDTTRFQLDRSLYLSDKPARIGSGGTTIFYFSLRSKAKFPSKSRMTFVYARPWEKALGKQEQVALSFVKAKPH